MGSLDRLLRRVVPRASGAGDLTADTSVDAEEEGRLWALLRENPNDVDAFGRLAELVRRRAGEGHVPKNRQLAADDAVWALAEELAHSGRAWFPLIELARLSVHEDREAALRRLGTAAERDHSGHALAMGLRMLRETHLPAEALGLGVGHWRPREHDPEVGRQLVEAAVEAGRKADARRHLDALLEHPDVGRVQALRVELERRIAEETAKTGGIPAVDVRERDMRERVRVGEMERETDAPGGVAAGAAQDQGHGPDPGAGHGILRVFRRR